MIRCASCGTEFVRKPRARKDNIYCSKKCRGQGYYQAHGAVGRTPRVKLTEEERKRKKKEYDANRRLTPTQLLRRDSYNFKYNRLPKVKQKNAERMKEKWNTDPEYRERQIERLRNLERKRVPAVEIPSPYTGHMWLDKVRSIVAPHIDSSTIWADDYHDDMGEALLALLEGRDPKQAVKDYRKQEYMPRYLTIRVDDWHTNEGSEAAWFEKVMPKAPSAEDEYISAAFDWNDRGYRYHDVSTKNRGMKHKTQQPSRRRMNNGKGWRRKGDFQ